MLPQKQELTHSPKASPGRNFTAPAGQPQSPSVLLSLGFASSELDFSASTKPWLQGQH